jgi:hypothetical protein
MGKFAKNYLPILFNLYITEIIIDKDPTRQSVLDTIRCYLTVSDKDLVNVYLTQAVSNYEMYSAQHEQSLAKDQNNNGKATGGIKVNFDFNKMTPTKSSAPAAVSSGQCEPNLFSKYSSLDLIAVLCKYANDSNVPVVYNLAMSAIEVCLLSYLTLNTHKTWLR